MSIHDHDEKAVFLPMFYGVRATYRMYCRDQGWHIYTTNTSKTKRRWIGSGPPKDNIVSYGCFHKYWALNYSHVKPSNRREDVCNRCFIFLMRKRYAAFNPSMEDAEVDDDAVDEEVGEEVNAAVPLVLDCNVTEQMILVSMWSMSEQLRPNVNICKCESSMQ